MSPLSSFYHPQLPTFLLRQEDDLSCAGACLVRWKVAFAALLLLEGLLFGHAVLLVKRLTPGPAFRTSVHIGNALSAGVFFATGMLHVLPEAVELLTAGEDPDHVERQEEEHHEEEEEGHQGHGTQFPWAFLILMLSFYFVFFVEQIVIPKLTHLRSARPEQKDLELNSATEQKEFKVALDESVESNSAEASNFKRPGFGSKEFVTGLIEILGLSAHSLFESMALGLSREFGTVLNIFIATAAHRWATSLAIAFKLSRSLSYLPFLLLLFLFSAMVPLGIGIGAALSELSIKAQGALFAVSAGTFIYIGVFESMAEEYVEDKKWPMRKFAATLAGAGIIVVTTILLVRFDIHG